MTKEMENIYINVDALKSGSQFNNTNDIEKIEKTGDYLLKKLCTSQGFREAYENFKRLNLFSGSNYYNKNNNKNN